MATKWVWDGDTDITGSMTASSVNVEQLFIDGDTITNVISSEISDYTTETIINLSATEWVDNSQTVTINGLTSTSDVTIYPPSNRTAFLAYGNAQVSVTTIAQNSLTFECSVTPEIDINEVIILWR